MEFAHEAPAFERLGYRLAALAVDPPPRAARLRQQLRLPFPILCDTERQAVRAWGLYNAHERGGIAVPATVVIAAAGRIEHLERESMVHRLRARGLLAFLAAENGEGPRRRALWPRLRDWYRALRR